MQIHDEFTNVSKLEPYLCWWVYCVSRYREACGLHSSWLGKVLWIGKVHANLCGGSICPEQSPTKEPRGWHWKPTFQVALLFEPQKQIQVTLNSKFQIQVTDQ